MKVLFIDDEISLLNSIGRIMRLWGIGYDIVDCGSKALSLLSESEVNGNIYDIVFIDISMPEINGLKLIREIKLKYNNLSCVIMTGFSDENSKNEAYNAGCDNFLRKPFTPVELKETIDQTLNINE